MSLRDDDFVQRLALGWVTTSREDMLRQLNQVLEAERAKTAELALQLEQEKRRSSDLEAIVCDFCISAPVPELPESNFARKVSSVSTAEQVSSSDEEEPSPYSRHVRQEKIARYRWKRQQRLQRVSVSRSFLGRRTAALNRQRVRGRFARRAAEP